MPRTTMRRQAASLWTSSPSSLALSRHRGAAIEPIGRRYVRVYATPTSAEPAAAASAIEGDAAVDVSALNGGSEPDAKFEVIGAPFSMLSVQLAPSQNLYTRRGTLVAVSGKAENAVSTLSLLSPLTRAPLGIPFLYQSVSSSTPLSALITPRTPATTLTTIHLDGRLDWLLTQRDALLAWTGHTLSVKPRLNTRLPFQHWGGTFVSGRGVLALVGRGMVYQVRVGKGEEYIVHPGNVVAYTQTPTPPTPYRFRSSTLKLSVPSISGLLPDTRFFNEMKRSALWNWLASTLFKARTWTRRTIWGDRLFLRFEGPTTILIQSRGNRLRDSLSTEQINELADAPAGHVQNTLRPAPSSSSSSPSLSKSTSSSTSPSATAIPDSTSQARKVDKVVSSKDPQDSKLVHGEGVESGPDNFAPEPVEIKERHPAGVQWVTVSRGGKVDWKEETGEKRP